MAAHIRSMCGIVISLHLIPPEKIDIPITATSGDSPNNVDVPRGADLVELIRHENNSQGIGMEDGKLLVPEKTLDDKIFLRTALIREAHVPKIFAHPGQKRSSRCWNESTHSLP